MFSDWIFFLNSYVDQATAIAQNLTFTSSDTIVMRADYKTVLSPSGPGRNSVRIQSVKQWSTAVTVLNVRHMPQGQFLVILWRIID